MFFVVLNNNRKLFPWTTLNGQYLQPWRIVFSVKCELNFVSFFARNGYWDGCCLLWRSIWRVEFCVTYQQIQHLIVVFKVWCAVFLPLWLITNFWLLQRRTEPAWLLSSTWRRQQPANRHLDESQPTADKNPHLWGVSEAILFHVWGPQVRVLWLSPRVIVTLIPGSCNWPRRYKSR